MSRIISRPNAWFCPPGLPGRLGIVYQKATQLKDPKAVLLFIYKNLKKNRILYTEEAPFIPKSTSRLVARQMHAPRIRNVEGLKPSIP